jgi:GDPmannose 4,6-dehydratase
MPVALVTGISGQDGIHLGQFLIEKGYEVYGMINGQKDDKVSLTRKKLPNIKLISGDLTDSSSLIAALQTVQPDEIYNLGAVSFVALSFSQPELVSNVTGLGTLRLLEAIRILNMEDKIKFYQASSSEMFGAVKEVPQNESTPFNPRSPYAVAKAFAHQIVVNYREAYKIFGSCGILFNHEGPNRGYEFVSRKITQAIARISLGLQSEIRLGNIESKRDWGYAGDYVEAMWLMLQQDNPDDFVVATGKTRSVREFLETAFKSVNIQNGIEKYVKFDNRFLRPSDVPLLIGDSTKAKEKLGWAPKVSFEEMVHMMVENDLRIESDECGN